MPFLLSNLSPIGGNSRRAAPGAGEAAGRGAFCLWAYRTEDPPTTVDTAGYFNAARQLLQAGDIILRVSVNASGVPQTTGFHLVNDVPAAPGNVDVADTLAITVTDID